MSNANSPSIKPAIVRPPELVDPAIVRASLATIVAAGQCFEVRAFNVTFRGERFRHKAVAGYFTIDAVENLVTELRRIDSAVSVHFTPNPVNPQLHARVYNRLDRAEEGGLTNGDQITGRRYLLIDVDPKRIKGISSTDDRHEAALALAERIEADMTAAGWSQPVRGDSGNGGHIMWPIDLPTDDGGLITRVLTAFGKRYDEVAADGDSRTDEDAERLKIDQAVKDPNRVWKLYGTRACKGDANAPGRPHRMSSVLSSPTTPAIVTRSQLESFAGPQTTDAKEAKPTDKNKPAGRNDRRRGESDFPAYVREFVAKFLDAKPATAATWGKMGSGTKYPLNECPFDRTHTNNDAAVFVADGGAVAFKCQHNSCSGNDWHALRAKFDPKPERGRQRKPQRAASPTVGNSEDAAPDSVTADDGFKQSLTELHNARQLVARFGETFRWQHERGAFATYDADCGRWVADKHGVVACRAKAIAAATWEGLDGLSSDDRAEAESHAVRSSSARGVEAMMKLARSEPGISVAGEQFDADPWLLNVANGVVDLRTGKLGPHDPRQLLTKYAPVAYDPDAKCPTLDGFLDRIQSGNTEMIGYLQRIAGLAATGIIREQEMYVFHGKGANGKSVFCDMLAGLLGDYAGLAPATLLTVRSNDEHPTEIADLQGLRCVFASETEEGARLRIQLVKRMTGDAKLKGRYMRQDYFEFDRKFKLILSTNNKPKITENTNAVWRRLRLVPFSVVIPLAEQDQRLPEKLKAEWPGILAWVVRGCLDWQRDGMQTPAAVLNATAEYQAEQDVLADFLAARCIRVGRDRDRITRTDLFKLYSEWAAEINEKNPLEKNPLFERIRALDGVVERSWRPVGRSVTERGFAGIRARTCLDDAEDKATGKADREAVRSNDWADEAHGNGWGVDDVA